MWYSLLHRRHLNTVLDGPAAFATHVGEPGEVGVAILVCQTGGASRFQQTHFLQALLQLNGFLRRDRLKSRVSLGIAFLSPQCTEARRESPRLNN